MFWTIVGALLFVSIGIPLILVALGIIGSGVVAVADTILTPLPPETEEQREEKERRLELERIREEESRRKQTPWAWAILLTFILLPLLIALIEMLG